ncbi:Uncharacterized conserved protein, contains HEPN domain [Cnuella takakiae]|uniref:Uncharacterized conserved protein, contains HEPN domain n=1 Tax=Cnuella takakiae TaxID=1302690 RepID=A0A1M4X2Y8_9BACT|nr:DUF86 domain-containing protein [Cnuella takakiae]OLY91551.1 hypothetical protein BUE76_06260 [Cnuella takakiae]SHE87830.1 Uncharacterized conserved protein, contains HEPN domain [Cnuella takakiae]
MIGAAADKQRLLHIRDAIKEIEHYVAGLTASVFFENSLIRSGCVFQLQIIGEAANHVSESLQLQHAEIEWRSMAGLRNIIVHAYWGIDYVQIWRIIKEDLPALKNNIDKILRSLP